MDEARRLRKVTEKGPRQGTAATTLFFTFTFSRRFLSFLPVRLKPLSIAVITTISPTAAEILAEQALGSVLLPLAGMITTSDDILHPILFRQNSRRPLFDRCRQMHHPRGRECPLHRLKSHDMAVATSEITPQLHGQAPAEVVAVA